MSWKRHAMSEVLSDSGISHAPDILGGKPVIAGTRISVELVLEKLAAGRSPQEICTSHALSQKEINTALQYT